MNLLPPQVKLSGHHDIIIVSIIIYHTFFSISVKQVNCCFVAVEMWLEAMLTAVMLKRNLLLFPPAAFNMAS